MRRRLIMLVLMGLTALAVASCSDSDDKSDSATATTSAGAMDYGKAGDPAKAARTVDVAITPANTYEPALIDVKPGETVTFKVTNQGSTIHEFVIGDQAAQDAYEKEMAAMGTSPMKMPDKPNGGPTGGILNIDPGQTESITWTFPNAGAVIYASHEPGDQAAGLTGLIAITP